MIGRATRLRFGRGLDRWTPGETLYAAEAIKSWAEDEFREREKKREKGVGQKERTCMGESFFFWAYIF